MSFIIGTICFETGSGSELARWLVVSRKGAKKERHKAQRKTLNPLRLLVFLS